VTEVLDRPRVEAQPSGIIGAGEVLTEAALEFLAELHHRFDGRRRNLIAARQERQARFDCGELPDFPPDGADSRSPARPTPRC
jgi:malate synthase